MQTIRMAKSGLRLSERKGFASIAGAAAWISSLQYFILQWLVASAWPRPYSPSNNFISDLGATVCSYLNGNFPRYVCSPEHNLMNLSFISLGVTTAFGALLLRTRINNGLPGLIATALFVTSGIGIAMVGLNPENLSIGRHILGAYLNAYASSLAIIATGLCMLMKEAFRGYGKMSIYTGSAIAAANLIDTLNVYIKLPILTLGIGHGGTEKLCNYPIYLWLAVTGVYFIMTYPNGSPSQKSQEASPNAI